MELRQALNDYPRIATGAVAVVILVAAVMIVRSSGGAPTSATPKAWFSTDDGKTWFADDANKVPPFQVNGKEAWRAYVYRGADGKEFVSHLERYAHGARGAIEKSQGSSTIADPTQAAGGLTTLEIKKPGQSRWVSAADPAADAVRQPIGPGGKADGAQPVVPE